MYPPPCLSFLPPVSTYCPLHLRTTAYRIFKVLLHYFTSLTILMIRPVNIPILVICVSQKVNHGCSKKLHLDGMSAFPFQVLFSKAQRFSDPFRAAITCYGSTRGRNGASSPVLPCMSGGPCCRQTPAALAVEQKQRKANKTLISSPANQLLPLLVIKRSYQT